MNEIRLGDVYKVYFDRSIDSKIKAKTWLCAVIKKEATSAIVVPLTANVRNGIKDINRVYFKLDYDGKKENACILSDIPIRVSFTRLKIKKTHLKKQELESTIAKSKNFRIIDYDSPILKNVSGVNVANYITVYGNIENIGNGDISENKEVTYEENTIWNRVGDIITKFFKEKIIKKIFGNWKK